MKKQLFFLLFTLISIPMFALRFEGGENIIIEDDVHEDIYVAGGTVEIRGKVYGDVIAAGGKVFLADTITGDVWAGGGELTIDGWVGDDVRVAGGKVYIRKGIRGDLILTGGEVDIDAGARIGGDLISASGDIDLDGDVMGNAKIGAGKFQLNGLVQGNLDLRGGDFDMNGTVGGPCTISVNSIDIGQSARFESPIKYWTKDGEVDFGGAIASEASASFDESLKKEQNFGKSSKKESRSPLRMLWYFLAIGFLAAVLQYLFGRRFAQAADMSEDKTFEMGLRGFLFFVATPIAAVLLTITLVGAPVGLLLGAVYLILFAISNVVTASVLTQWIKNRQGMTWNLPMIALVTAAVAVALKVVGWIPFLGWLVKFAVICIAFGALVTLLRNRNDAIETGYTN